jgi:hypothetical protein
VSFELELLRVNKKGKAKVIDRGQCPLDLSVAELKAVFSTKSGKTGGAWTPSASLTLQGTKCSCIETVRHEPRRWS